MASNSKSLDQFGKLPPAQKAMVAVFLLAAVAVLFYFMYYQGVMDRIAREKRTRDELETKLSQYKVELENKYAFQAEIQELKKKRERALEKLPAGDEIPSLLQKIHGQAMIVGLDISVFRREPAVARGFYAAIPVFMELRGTFHQIVTFFYYVGKLTRIVNISNIDFAVASAKADKVVLNAKVQAVTFKYSGPPKSGSKRNESSSRRKP